jgi:hypothetical protein
MKNSLKYPKFTLVENQLRLYALSILCVCSFHAVGKKQDGYKLKESRNFTKVYQKLEGSEAVSSVYKMWDEQYVFYIDDSSILKDSSHPSDPAQMYYRIYIPSAVRQNPTTRDTEQYVTGSANQPPDGTQEARKARKAKAADDGEAMFLYPGVTKMDVWGETDMLKPIGPNDFNKFLYIKKADFLELSGINDPKKYSFILSAITVPLKIHPDAGQHQATLLNSNFSLGSFIGVRLTSSSEKNSALDIGLFGGVASIDQNSSNNTKVTDALSHSMTAVNVGGGIMVTISSKTQIGAVLGMDHGFDAISRDYIYQNSPWFAISITQNFSFLGSSTDNSAGDGQTLEPNSGKKKILGVF